jgi:hypothetical protein
MHVHSTTISKIRAVAICAFMAFVLAFVLFAQDMTAIFDIGPMTDLPEMANLINDSGAHQVVAPQPDPEPPTTPPISGGMVALYFLVSLAVAARRLMRDASPTAQGYSVPLHWLLANPKTAPPARA